MADNLIPFMDRLKDKQVEALLYSLNEQLSGSYHKGSMWFVNREAALRALETSMAWGGEYAELLFQDVINILEIGDWLDITTVADTKKKYLNTITGSTREEEFDQLDIGARHTWRNPYSI